MATDADLELNTDSQNSDVELGSTGDLGVNLDAEQDQIHPETGDESDDLQADQVGMEETDIDELSDTDDEISSETVASVEVVGLRGQVEGLQQQLSDKKDEFLRLQAEFQNLKRRNQKDMDNTRKYAIERFAEDLLPVMDGLQRGIESISTDDETQQVAREGMELSLKNFEDAFKKHGLIEINPEGEPFNPEHHQAMSTQQVEGMDSNQVVAVSQKGYLINERVLRPALVSVSK